MDTFLISIKCHLPCCAKPSTSPSPTVSYDKLPPNTDTLTHHLTRTGSTHQMAYRLTLAEPKPFSTHALNNDFLPMPTLPSEPFSAKAYGASTDGSPLANRKLMLPAHSATGTDMNPEDTLTHHMADPGYAKLHRQCPHVKNMHRPPRSLLLPPASPVNTPSLPRQTREDAKQDQNTRYMPPASHRTRSSILQLPHGPPIQPTSDTKSRRHTALPYQTTQACLPMTSGLIP